MVPAGFNCDPKRRPAGLSDALPRSRAASSDNDQHRLISLDILPQYAPFWWRIYRVEAVFKALADPNRRALLDHLYQHNGQTLNQLCRHLKMTRQGVSKHLNILIQAQLVVPLWNGREK